MRLRTEVSIRPDSAAMIGTTRSRVRHFLMELQNARVFWN
jgi:hypothetical protein